MGRLECILHIAEHLLQGLEHVLCFFNVFARQEARLDSCEMRCQLPVGLHCSEGESMHVVFHHQWI